MVMRKKQVDPRGSLVSQLSLLKVCHATDRLSAKKTGRWLLMTTVIFMWDSKPKV